MFAEAVADLPIPRPVIGGSTRQESCRIGVNALELRAQVGFAHAYDLTHLLALALKKTGSSGRTGLRNALEHLEPHEGLVTRYERPFTPARHEALGPHLVRIARYDRVGHLKSVAGRK